MYTSNSTSFLELISHWWHHAKTLMYSYLLRTHWQISALPRDSPRPNLCWFSVSLGAAWSVVQPGFHSNLHLFGTLLAQERNPQMLLYPFWVPDMHTYLLYYAGFSCWMALLKARGSQHGSPAASPNFKHHKIEGKSAGNQGFFLRCMSL